MELPSFAFHSLVLDGMFADPLDFLTHAVEVTLQLKICSDFWLGKKAMDVSCLTSDFFGGATKIGLLKLDI